MALFHNITTVLTKDLLTTGDNVNNLKSITIANVDTSKDLFTWRNIEDDPYDAILRSFNFLSEYVDA